MAAKIQLENINIEKIDHLFSPQELKQDLPCDDSVRTLVYEARESIKKILTGEDHRVLGIVGPCSIHDYDAALDYANKFKALREEVKDTMYLIMRVYFEKPRTTVGWRGMLIDPDMNNSNNISKGLYIGRKILIEINKLGVPAGSEYLDPVVPNYIDDLICWASIGARTIESQTHRDMASGVSVPVGFKNSTDGEVLNAVNAMLLSVTPRGFIGVNREGVTSIIHTKGNKYTHMILRGGRSGPNYFPDDIDEAVQSLKKVGLAPRIIVDCSHGNSMKKHENQEKVLHSILQQRIAGNSHILGFMLESNLYEGAQDFDYNPKQLEYGVSVTDACIGFQKTTELMRYCHETILRYSTHLQYGN